MVFGHSAASSYKADTVLLENGIWESLIQVSFDQLGPVLSKLNRGNHPSSA
jgi:hypothetical protein